jgi:hypothetical protein
MSDDQSTPITGPNYLYINELELPTGRTPNDCIAECKEWVQAMRETGEFKSVRLYIHNTGPIFAFYLLMEPKSWESLEKGMEKVINATGMMDRPWNWGHHSDHLLNEIPVE